LEDAYHTEQTVSDFHRIMYEKELLTWEKFNLEHDKCFSFIKTEVSKSNAEHIIVVTHHVPSFRLSSPDFKNSRINGAFTVELSDYMETSPVEYWIYGHSHRNIDKVIGKTRCVTNQLGYVFYNEHHTFSAEKLIKI
jgi:hypothetical protein